MAADTNKASMASLSSAQLAEKLEKSEAGRKKLRQAISILQEKLDATEKVLKVNDTLRQESEQERQRAESEKKKAEEERRLRSILEKDSATIKDQLAKVLQRLGAVESKQKSDKKEIERVRNEVKLSVEGMRVASQAVDAIQSSFQTLENKLLEKVNAAFEEAHAASEAVHHVQSSLQSLENKVVKKGASPDNELQRPKEKPVPDKLVDEISHLFNRERQSHCKIQQRLFMLKSALKLGESDNLLTSAEDFDPESPTFSKKKKNYKASKKRKSRGEEGLLDCKARKREKLYDVDVINSAVNRTSLDGLKHSKKDQSMSSPLLIEYQMTSDEQGYLPDGPPSHNTTSNGYIEEAIVDHRGSSNAQVTLEGSKVVKQKENQRNLTVQMEKIDQGSDMSRGCLKSTIRQNGGSSEIRSEDDLELMQIDKLADREENPERGLNASGSMANNVSISVAHCDDSNEASDIDLDFGIRDDSEDEWWSQNRTLLSPSLPEIPSPLHHSPCPSREPSPCRGFFNSKVDTTALLDFANVNHKVPVSDASDLTEVAINKGNIQGATIQHTSRSIEACVMQLNVSLQRSSSVVSNSTLQPCSVPGVEEQPNSNPEIELNTNFGTSQLVLSNICTELGVNAVECQVQSVKPNKDAGINVSEASIGATEASADIERTFQKVCRSPDPISTTMPGAETVILLDTQEKETHFNEDYTFEAFDNATITEINYFLEVLPPIPSVFPDELCASNPPQGASEMVMTDGVDTQPRDSIDPSGEVCTSSQPQAACEMQMLKLNDTKHSVSIGEESHDSIDFQHVTNLSQNTNVQSLPIQEEADGIEVVRDRENSFILERSSGSDSQAVLTSSTKPSSSCVVFLLQAFNLQEVDVDVNVTSACIIAIDFKEYLSHTNLDKEEMQLQGTRLSRASVDVPLKYLACSFISIAVELVRLEKGGEHWSSEAQSIYSLMQAFVVFVRSMFKEKSNTMFDTIFAQLERFLIQGEAMLITLHGVISPCEDALSVARVIHDKKHHSYQYTEATLKDIHAGGKVLAALCQVLSCVTHLQNIVYEVLGWCDKDVMWLLTVFSSFSSICGDTAFMAEADDLVGHAICAIIIELVASVEQEYTRRADSIISQSTQGSADVSSNLPMGWAALRNSLEVNEKFSMEEVFLVVWGALQCMFGSTHDSFVPAAEPFPKNVPLCTKQYSNDKALTRPWEGTGLSDKEALKDPAPWKQVPIANEYMQIFFSVKQRDSVFKNLGSEGWQKKYVEAVRALELIAQFMGWEWTYNQLILRCLWKMVVSGSAQLCVAGVSHIISILVRMGVKGGRTDLPGLGELKKCLAHIVQSTSTFMEKAEPLLLFDLH
eukprot:c21240_g1_i1 orf=135-4172(+)